MMKPAIRWPLAVLLFLSVLPIPGRAGDVPLWEAGAGVAVIDFCDYRGSDERNTYVLPVPYFVYRGKFLKIDREKTRGLLFKRDWAELDVSLSGLVPVKSSDNEARLGMPNLDPTLELRLPVRPVIDIHLDYQGYVFQPQLNLDVRDSHNFAVGFAISWIFTRSKTLVQGDI